MPCYILFNPKRDLGNAPKTFSFQPTHTFYTSESQTNGGFITDTYFRASYINLCKSVTNLTRHYSGVCNMADLSQEELEFLRDHLFLPPCLPQEADQAVGVDAALLRTVTQALRDFGDLIPEGQRQMVQHVHAAISKLNMTRDDIDGSVNEEQLLKALEEMSDADYRECMSLLPNSWSFYYS